VTKNQANVLRQALAKRQRSESPARSG